jgi:hypothetical protein
VHSVSCSLTTSNNSQRLNVSDQPAIINEERTLNIFVRPSATLVDATNARNVSQPLKRLIPWHNSRAAASADTVSADEGIPVFDVFHQEAAKGKNDIHDPSEFGRHPNTWP